MKERLVSAVVGLLFAVMATLFGIGARVAYHDHLDERDYQDWVTSPGRLLTLELNQTLHRMRWQYVVACRYEFDYGGARHVAGRFDLKGVVYPTIEEAKEAIEAELGIAGRARWRKVQHGSSDDWALDAQDITVAVRHSPRDPTSTTLTPTPPMSAWLNWTVILTLGVLALVTGLGSVALAVVTFRRG